LKTKILITGGSGFLGTNLVDYYHKKKLDIINLDITAPKIEEHNSYFINCNLLDLEKMKNIINDFSPSHVVHLAARTDLDGKNLSDYEANTQGLYNLIESIKDLKVEKAIFTSSMLVCEAGYSPLNESDFSPTTPYGESKAIGEKYIRDTLKEDLDWNIIRPTSLWGPWFNQPYSQFFDILKNGVYVNISKYSSTKTFGYVENAVFQIDKILFSDSKIYNKEVFYIGDMPPINISIWANEILYSLNKKPALALPFFMFKIIALAGDFLSLMGVSFPMSSFRLNNMTTDNIQNLENTYSLAGEPPIKRSEGIIKTLEWMSSRDNL